MRTRFALAAGFSALSLALAACSCPRTAEKRVLSTAPVGVRPYQVQSPYLQDPEKAIELMVKNAEFWKGSYDPAGGGFFTVVKQDGSLGQPRYKSTLSQSRIAYAYARAYMVTGNREYLTYARRALDFMYARSWDQKNGGFHTCVDAQGRNIDDSPMFDPLNGNQYEKWSFMQEYALLGIAAVYDATRNDADLAFLTRARALLDEKLWDGRKGLEGYYDSADYDWSHPRGKGFTPTVDAITTHGEAMVLLTRDPRYKARLVELADGIVRHIYPTLQTRKLGFEEFYDSDWKEAKRGFFFIGHVLKAAWCLQRAYLVEPKEEYRLAAEVILKQVWEKAWDHSHGGPYQFGDSFTGQVTNKDKLYWGLEQAITAGLVSHYVTGDPVPLEMADQSLRFFTDHLYDWKYGEVLDTVSEDGSRPILTDKGSYWKSAYHAMETGYYVYLYGNLFLRRQPVTLHYWIDRSPKDRTLPLDPIAIQDSALAIAAVTHDGKPYARYDARARTLSVPAGAQGEFQVTFAMRGK